MSKIFLDSNILIYLYSSNELQKTAQVQSVIEAGENFVVSTQVLFEFSYVASRKLKIGYDAIEKALKEFATAFTIIEINYAMIVAALKLAAKHKYSFPDSLIIVAAQSCGCDTLFTEDMHNAHVIDKKMKIVNLFK